MALLTLVWTSADGLDVPEIADELMAGYDRDDLRNVLLSMSAAAGSLLTVWGQQDGHGAPAAALAALARRIVGGR